MRLTISIEGYTREIAVPLIKQRIQDWLCESRGFCLINRGPGARVRNPALSIFMILYFGMTPSRCVIHAACNEMILLLCERSAAYQVSRLHRSIMYASARCRPHTEGRP